MTAQATRAKKWRHKNPSKFRLSLDKSAIKHFLNTADGDQLNWLLQNVRHTIHTRSHTAMRLTRSIYRLWPDIDSYVLNGATSVKLRVQEWLRWHPAHVVERGMQVAGTACHQHRELNPLDVIGYCVTHPLTARKQLAMIRKE